MTRGRSKQLITERNRKLFERYYYWTEVRRLRIDDSIRKLSEEEFFISEARVMQILRGMLQAGYTVAGKPVPAKHFTGFRVQPKAKRADGQLSLFPSPAR